MLLKIVLKSKRNVWTRKLLGPKKRPPQDFIRRTLVRQETWAVWLYRLQLLRWPEIHRMLTDVLNVLWREKLMHSKIKLVSEFLSQSTKFETSSYLHIWLSNDWIFSKDHKQSITLMFLVFNCKEAWKVINYILQV